MNLTRLFHSLSFRLQSVTIFLSIVGVAFGVKSYVHIRHTFGEEASQVFWSDLELQLVVATVVNVLVAIVLFRLVTQPIRNLTEVMRSLTENNLEIEVPYTKLGSEIGSMARKAEIFKKNAIAKVKLEQETIENEKKLREEKIKAMNDLAERFDRKVQTIIREVVSGVAQLKTNSEHMAKVISNTNDRAAEVVRTTLETLENVKNVASSAEVLSSSTHEIEEKIHQSSHSVRLAVQAQEKADGVSKALAEAASKIGEILDMIQNIAGQINLLALNATIESARAGEAGKGFAVVANEVKNLAGQTTKATDEISSHVAHIQQVSVQVIDALSTIGSAVKDVDTYSSAISQAVGQQTETTREIADSMGIAADRTGRISVDVGEVKQDSVKAMDSSDQVLQVVNNLSQQSERLTQEVSAFIKEIAA